MDIRVDLSGISLRLKQIRSIHNLTPKQVFLKTGISTGNLSELENGKYPPSTKTLILLSELYRVSVDWILKGFTKDSEVASAYEDTSQLFPNEEMRSFVEKLSVLWANGDRDVQGWIVVQLRQAFPQIALEIQKERGPLQKTNTTRS